MAQRTRLQSKIEVVGEESNESLGKLQQPSLRRFLYVMATVLPISISLILLVWWRRYVRGDITIYGTNRIGAICRDGWESAATGSGACSWHHGVREWVYPVSGVNYYNSEPFLITLSILITVGFLLSILSRGYRLRLFYWLLMFCAAVAAMASDTAATILNWLYRRYKWFKASEELRKLIQASSQKKSERLKTSIHFVRKSIADGNIHFETIVAHVLEYNPKKGARMLSYLKQAYNEYRNELSAEMQSQMTPLKEVNLFYIM